jgi:hypothetical protein
MSLRGGRFSRRSNLKLQWEITSVATLLRNDTDSLDKQFPLVLWTASLDLPGAFTSGSEHPRATGMWLARANSKTASARRLVKASSTPGSVSMMMRIGNIFNFSLPAI